MSGALLVSLGGLFVNILALFGGAIWLVGRIRESNSVLNETVKHLNQALGKLEGVMEMVSKQQHNQEVRLTVLETIYRIRRRTNEVADES